MEELLRKKKVLDMMISMHSYLRDRFRHRSQLIDLILLLSAAILNTLIFINPDYVKTYLGDYHFFNFVVGLFSIATFLLSLTVLLVKWKEKAEKHHHAANQLTKLLNLCRDLCASKFINDEEISAFTARYDEVCAVIEPVPQNEFNILKSKYLRKRELSKFLDSHPVIPYWLAWMKFHFSIPRSNPNAKTK